MSKQGQGWWQPMCNMHQPQLGERVKTSALQWGGGGEEGKTEQKIFVRQALLHFAAVHRQVVNVLMVGKSDCIE